MTATQLLENLISLKSQIVEIDADIADLIRAEKQRMELDELAKSIQTKSLKTLNINFSPELELLENGFKIIAPEHPPKSSIYSRVEFKNGAIVNPAFKLVRERWHRLIHEAACEYRKHRQGAVAPCIICIKFFVPRVCDIDNFTEGFIIDGLMYSGLIKDDNLYNVNALIREAFLDKDNPRTEITVLKKTVERGAMLAKIL